MINIRRGKEPDIERVSLLWLDMVRELNPSYTPRVEWWRNITLGMMRHYENYYLFVAEDGQDVVGFIDLMVVPEPATGWPHGVCRHLYVTPGSRSAGVSRRLILQCEEQARKEGAVVIELECGDEQHPFWQGMGYRPVGIKLRKHVGP